MKNNDSGYIDKNYIDTNGDGFKFCKIRIRNKIPEMGDKFQVEWTKDSWYDIKHVIYLY